MGKVGKAGKAVVMKKTNQLLMVKDQYVQPPGPGELVVHNVYTSVRCRCVRRCCRWPSAPDGSIRSTRWIATCAAAWSKCSSSQRRAAFSSGDVVSRAGADAHPRRSLQILGSDVAGQVAMAPEGSKARRARRSCAAAEPPTVQGCLLG